MFKKIFISCILAFCYTQTFAAGWIETSEVFKASGWACDTTNPNAPGFVHVYRDDGHFLGGVALGSYREDAVKKICKSNTSNHGFSMNFNIPNNLFDNQWHSVKYYVFSTNGNVSELENSPQQVFFSSSYAYKCKNSNQVSWGYVATSEINVPSCSGSTYLNAWALTKVENQNSIEVCNNFQTGQVTPDGYVIIERIYPRPICGEAGSSIITKLNGAKYMQICITSDSIPAGYDTDYPATLYHRRCGKNSSVEPGSPNIWQITKIF